MSTIIIFFGRPAVGKTTIIGYTFPEHHKVDVLSYVKNYLKNCWVSKEHILKAYHEAYAKIKSINYPTLIAEFGSSCPELDTLKINELAHKKRKLIIFVCEAPGKICLKRIKTRNGLNNVQLRKKILQSDNIQKLTKQFDQANISYHMLDMTKDLETNKKIILSKLPHN